MKILVIALALFIAQPAPARMPLASLAGRWASTVTPPEGQAPTIGPLTIEVKGEKVFIAVGSSPATEAVVYSTRGSTPAQDVTLLVVKSPPGPSSSRTIQIRPIAANQLRYEMLIEFTDGRPNWTYAETFAKSK